MVKLRQPVPAPHTNEGHPMSLIGRIVTKLLGNEDRPVVRDDRNYDSGTPLGRLVTKILRK